MNEPLPCWTCERIAREGGLPYDEVYEINHPHWSSSPPSLRMRSLTVGLVIVVAVGVVLLVLGAVKNYGPLYTAGGIWLGFAFGVHKTRQHVKRELEKARTGVRS